MTVEEVELQYQLNGDMLKQYEYMGVIPRIRQESEETDYTEEDCRWIGLAKHMQRAGISMETLRAYELLRERGKSTLAQQRTLISQQREWMEERIAYLQQTLECLDCWIEEM